MQADMVKELRKQIDWWVEIHNRDVAEIKELTEHGFSQNQIISKLRREMAETTEILREAVENENDRVA